MSITKRTRFEILRRDNHTCRYCHAVDTPLTIDHVVPTALGGNDDPSNLVAACRDCNAGKSSTSPDASMVAQVSEDAVRWAAAMRLAGQRALEAREVANDRVRPFFEFWIEGTEGLSPWAARKYELPMDWQPSVAGLLDAGLPMRQLLEAAIVAQAKRPAPDNAFRYMLGVANNMLAKQQQYAQQLITDGSV